jgi:hypothetical protein
MENLSMFTLPAKNKNKNICVRGSCKNLIHKTQTCEANFFVQKNVEIYLELVGDGSRL